MTDARIIPDESNPNCLRVYIDGAQWCKVYGFTREDAQLRADKIISALCRSAETIVAAAVRIPVAEEYLQQTYRGRRMYPEKLIVTAPPPARHGTLMHPLPEGYQNCKFEDQGFITSTGRYVEREEALQIALASGQPMIDHPSRNPKYLFSEDLW